MNKKIKYIIGNWKTGGDIAKLARYESLADDGVVLCVPFALLSQWVPASAGMTGRGGLALGAQDSGPSAKLIADAGAKYCLLGHSSKRLGFGETNEIVAAKAADCLINGLVPIICVGETREDREAGRTMEVVENQVWQSVPNAADIKSEIIIAYEPVWAIGTGLIPMAEDISKVHNHIREILEQMGLAGTAVLYGGSISPSNVAEVVRAENLDGIVVGGASLDFEQFKEIINARQ